MTSTNPAADGDYTERHIFRDAWDALRDLISKGEDVDPAELADTRAKAEAEEQVETGRRSKHERDKAAKRQAEARKAITAALADLDPDAGAAAQERINKAHEEFIAVVAAEILKAEAHNEKLRDAVRPYRDTGLEALPEDYAPRRGWPENVDRDNHIQVTPGHPTSWIMWRGVRYSVYAPNLQRWAGSGSWRNDLAKARARITK